MKLGAKLSFGINAVQAGQKTTVINAVPQLLANSTSGKFTITSPVSKALNIAAGENIMFLNNIAGVEDAIRNRVDDVVNYANENGIDLDSRDGEDKVLAAFTQWFIAKGVPMYKGNQPIMAKERFTKEEKEAYLKEHAADIVAANRDALVAEFGSLSDEELAENLTIDMVSFPKYHLCSGAKTAANSSATGVGLQLGFTNAAVWAALKADLGDAKTKKNRIFNVELSEMQKVTYNNGKDNVEIDILPIVFDKDVDPVVRGKKEEAE